MKIRYLHISDLHFAVKEEAFNQGLVTRAMVKKIKEFDDKVDFIIITGDLVYSGKKDEFDIAEQFCNELLNACNLTNKNIFVVPGNHDLDREGMNKAVVKRIYSFNKQDEVNEILEDETMHPFIMSKFDNFNAFASKVMGRELFNPEITGYLESLTINKNNQNCNVNLMGLNSSLFAGYEGDDKQKLALGLYQIEPCLEKLDNNNISIGFFHHPFSCYHPEDKFCEKKLVRELDLILTGHCHSSENVSIISRAGQTVLISAGASFETRESYNSFNVVELDTETGAGKAIDYKYIFDDGVWIRDKNANPDEEDGSFPFQIQRMAKANEVPQLPVKESMVVDKSIPLIRINYNPNEVLRAYRNMLINKLQRLPLSGIDVGASDAENNREKMELDSVYIELDTKTFVEIEDKDSEKGDFKLGYKDTRPLSALEAATKHRCLVILGDPGSGKSTFVNHLALSFASQNENKDINDKKSNDIWPESAGKVVPIHIILRDFIKSVPESEKKAEVRHLWEFICKRLRDQKLENADVLLEEALDNGTALVLLDGLDEITVKEKRVFVRNAVDEFAQRYDKCRLVVTCRTLSYQKPEWQLDKKMFPSFELAPFDDEKIDGFITAWYADLARMGNLDTARADNLAARLKVSVTRKDLSLIADNPLLLTVMALVNTHKGRLPDARVLLYEECVEILLWRWEEIKSFDDDKQPMLQELLMEAGRTGIDLKKALWQLAFTAHKDSKKDNSESLADISKWDLIKGLSCLHPDKNKDWAEKVVEIMNMRAGLLLERETDVYTFPHRTFQEYLAGAHLSVMPRFEDEVMKLIESSNLWREVILLAVGRLFHVSGETGRPLLLACKLLTSAKGDSEADWRNIWYAGEILVEIGINRLTNDKFDIDQKELAQKRLVELLEGGYLKPVERAAAGTALGKIGDTRFDPNKWHLPKDDNLGFVRIEAGKFQMGSDENESDAFKDEFPRSEVSIPEFSISKYPVTVAQFRAFVEDSGYEAGKGWENSADNSPVTSVSWDDAKEYCKWLSEKLKGIGYGEVRLPTEAEWEKAARGEGAGKYPWGDEADINKMNFGETGINGVSPVGCFPGAGNSYGLQDMNGNVWEWVEDDWHADYNGAPDDGRAWIDDINKRGSDRVLRGGSWADFARICRSASRGRNRSGIRFDFFGFRLVLPRSV